MSFPVLRHPGLDPESISRSGNALTVPSFDTGWTPDQVRGDPEGISRKKTCLDVEVRDFQRVGLNELTARFDVVAHQRGEDVGRLVHVERRDLQERA